MGNFLLELLLLPIPIFFHFLERLFPTNLSPMKRKANPVFPIYTVDSFAEAPFRGNPAAVCFLMGHQSDDWMQKVAKEMNLSETAFFMRGENAYLLRWFTPETEVDLCGHATLATAHIIWETEMIGPEESIAFDTRSGRLHAKRKGDWIELNFPAEGPQPCEAPFGLGPALGGTPQGFFKNRMDYLVAYESAAAIREMEPDFAALARISTRGFIVTAPSDDPEFDYICRFFAPGVGIDEDPVTGSAHCCLSPFWAVRTGKKVLRGFQASERGGIVEVEMVEDRVLLRGQAITVVQGVYTG